MIIISGVISYHLRFAIFVRVSKLRSTSFASVFIKPESIRLGFGKMISCQGGAVKPVR